MLGLLLASIGLLAGTAGALPAAVPATVPMRVVNNHCVVDVMLDGAGPYRFIVDTGAGNIVDPAVAAQIGARTTGRVPLFGVGAAGTTGARTTIHDVRIGAAHFDNVPFIVTDTRTVSVAAEGPAIDGLIGSEIIGKGVTVFDYEREELTFGANRDAVDGAGSTVLPMTERNGFHRVACALADVETTCAIDTGSRLALTVLTPFSASHPEIVPASLSTPGIDGFGVGGAAYGKLGMLSSLSFGPIVLHDVVTDFSVQQRGVFASRAVGANVGGGVLRRFTVAFDEAHNRIGLRPNADFTAPYPIDRSGLFLGTRGGAIVVLDVRAGTPAQRAGLQRDDVIDAADARQYTPQTLPDLRAVLQGSAGTRVDVTVVRGAEPPRTVPLTLEAYF